MSFELTKGQKDALELLQQWYRKGDRQVFRLSGYAGVGKTVCITEFAKALGISGQIAYVAYTGKASQVMVRRGLPACTIHRLIYDVDQTSQKLKFKKKKFLDVDPAMIVVDEASMVDEKCFGDLCSFGKPIVVVGDPGQLPPVQGKSSCLSNPDIILTEIVRQALDNPIVALATDIRCGKRLQRGMYRNAIPIGNLADVREDFLIKPDQVICATNRVRNELNQRMRQYIGHYDRLPEVGDKLISLKNLWTLGICGQPVVNGTTGVVRRIVSKRNDLTRVLFQPDGLDDCGVVDLENCRFFGQEPEWRDPKNLNTPVGDFDYGYAVTCNKAQGSEYPMVCGVIPPEDHWPFGEDRVRWLYTLVTRAVSRLALVYES